MGRLQAEHLASIDGARSIKTGRPVQLAKHGSWYQVVAMTLVPSGTVPFGRLIGDATAHYVLAHYTSYLCRPEFHQNAINDTLPAGKVSLATEVATNR